MSVMIPTVLGEVPSDRLGRVLTHEHIVSLYGSWWKLSPQPHPAWSHAALEHYTPLLSELKATHGVDTIVEVTPGWESRGPEDLELWAELSRRSGVNVVVTTGDFMGSDLGLLGRERGEQTVAQLADQMIREAEEGILGTKVRAGIIKVHVRRETPYGRRLMQAAAIAQMETGLCLTTCTGDHTFYVDVWEMAGVPPARICLSHGDTRPLPEVIGLFKRGCSYNFTLWGIRSPKEIGWPWPEVPRYHSPAFLATLAAEGYVSHLFPSMDYSAMGGFTEDGRVCEDLYHVEGRTYSYMFRHGVPNMKRFGVTDAEVETMLRQNPRRLLEPA